MDVVRKDRGCLKSKITKLENNVSTTYDPLIGWNESSITHTQKKVSSMQVEFNDIYKECHRAAKTLAEVDAEEPEFLSLEERLDKLSIKLETMKRCPPPSSSTTTTTTTSASCDVKLPKLELPFFSGSIQDWLSFQDLFQAAVHSNSKLTGAQKLQYLKGQLKGDAALLIQNISITNDNFDEAWKALQERYDNQRELIRVLFERLLSQPNAASDNPPSLRKLADTSKEIMRSLTVMKLKPEEIGECIIVHILNKKVDEVTRLEWEKGLKPNELPEMKDYFRFLEDYARMKAAAKAGACKGKVHTEQHSSSKQPKAVHVGTTDNQAKVKCDICGENHPYYQCQKFISLSVSDRWQLVKEKKLCVNCIRSGHWVKDCKSKNSCKKCSQKHNTMLHQEAASAQTQDTAVNLSGNSGNGGSKSGGDNSASEGKSQAQVTPNKPVTFCFSSNTHGITQVLLTTAIVKIRDSSGQEQQCRALLDTASQASMISESCIARLGLRRQRVKVPIVGPSAVGIGTSRGQSQCTVSSFLDPSFSINVKVLIMNTVTGTLPYYKCDPAPWTHINNIKLADPTCHIPGYIDILLGGDVFGKLLLSGRIAGPEGMPDALETVFGWVLVGEVTSPQAPQGVSINHSTCNLDSALQRFWELEELPETKILTKEEENCEAHFNLTHKRDETGRFVVELPFNEDVQDLGNSRDIAIRRMQQLEKRWDRDNTHKPEYQEFMTEYLQLGHMELIPPSSIEISPKESYYIPHHFVLKPSSSTTKLRGVFNASSKSTSGISLNDKLMVGPTIQQDLICIMLRFRTHLIALIADIAKMYRQVKVMLKHRDFQRIIWRNSPDEEFQDYRLTTVTYGTASAPYLATKCLQQVALEEQKDFPLASKIILEDFYVDDCLTGASDTDSAIQLQKDLVEVLSRGGFQLRKWSSNDSAFLDSLPAEMKEHTIHAVNPECSSIPSDLAEPIKVFDTDDSIKTLGIQWQPATDIFTFTVVPPPIRKNLTKRTVLSDLAKIFDPLGWLSPTTIKAKILFQSLWKLKLEWDDALPEDLVSEWKDYTEQLPKIEEVKINRCIVSSSDSTYQLHGYCDASEKAYAAAVYLRCQSPNNEIKINLVAAKTRVAPIKQISLPRLELCGAVLLTKLMNLVKKSLQLKYENIYGWCDSTIVLAWIASPPQRWKTFVANRVAEIQTSSSAGLHAPETIWQHVNSEDNPADCASRGILPSQLANNLLWWHGPVSLQNHDISTSSIIPEFEDGVTTEERKVVASHHVAIQEFPPISKLSTLTKLVRVTAICVRYTRNFRNPTNKVFGRLTLEELDYALKLCIKLSQKMEFQSEINYLIRDEPLPIKSKLIGLNPFIDSNGILRVGGRLSRADIPYDKKHPILLSSSNHLTKLIIESEHLKLFHAGPQLLVSSLLNRFWILRCRDTVRKILRKCLKCHRQLATTAQQMMGDLPVARVTISQPFDKCGVDYAGPFELRVLKGRGQKHFKAYVALFICFATRAIHLEAVSDLSTTQFLESMKRFVSRRGKPSEMFSDCGTNFVGANNELKKLLELSNSEAVSRFFIDGGVKWHFNPPAAPHFGGIWEAGVKSMKYHLKRVIGNTSLDFEEFTTILTQVEACLNSRPLTAISSSPDDLTALTPGHFLIGKPLMSIPEPNYTHLKLNLMNRWQLCQQLVQHFWKRWSGEYLSRLQQRPKWWKPQKNLEVGDLVLLKDEKLQPNQWKLGRITKLHPGKDNLVRAVTLKTQDGILDRPVVKLSPLPLESES